ncbi:hypothetical protein [Sulfuriferula plumbiphila]|nr:hypothetical protein [Sulfuriferula plumbiphila]
MKILFKTIVVWLLLLSAPVQGFAAAAMMCCVPTQQQMTMMPADHAGHEMPRHPAAASMDHADCCMSTGGSHANAGTCSSCLAGCVGVVIAPPVIAVSAMPVYGSEAIPFRPRVFRSFVSATPERPPQSSFV